MSMHKIKPSEHEEEGLRLYGLPVGSPSQLSDCFRNGFAWADHCAQVEVEKLEEELETLRASNTIKQANIERLESELAEERKDKVFFKNQFEDLRNSWSNLKAENAKLIEDNETINAMFDRLQKEWEGLLDENAKLIAERDSTMSSFRNFHWALCDRFNYSHDPIDWRRDQISLIEHIANQHKEAALTICALRAEIDEYQAEREAMMKQEPYRYLVGETAWKTLDDATKRARASAVVTYQNLEVIPVYRDPLPAQQIPEGYALVPIEPTDEMVSAGESAWDEWLDVRLDAKMTGKPFAEYPSEDTHALCSRVAYKAMLSASKPKGDM